MTIILGIHGIGQQRKGPNTLHNEWWPAMQDGVHVAGADLASLATLRFAFYGDMFRPAGHLAFGDPPFDRRDIDTWEAELLQTWWQEAATVDPAVVHPEAQTLAAVPLAIQRGLNALMNSRFFAGIAEKALIFDLKQVKAYLYEDQVRTAVLAEVAKQMNDDVRVIIGHSLGSVIAYEALCAHPEWKVKALITLGSPLGIRNLIFDRLRPPPINSLGAWPGSIDNWINIVDRGDIVALAKDLRPLFGDRIDNLTVDNGAKAHNVSPYLTAKETGSAILRALR